ncbi:glutamine synthetase family protein [Cribrihabitans neustonicus]|uniref:glutamine synthetase family protein n=1 Tax=Cribrihabitans neustonicus TaxID=1429085 RepID=UPI003B5B2F5A
MAQDTKPGRLARLGLQAPQAAARAGEVLAQLRAEGIETLRVLFADQHGVLRGKAVTAEAAESVLAGGLTVPSTLLLKDTAQRTAFAVWDADSPAPLHGAGDVLLVPRPETFRLLPWSPRSAWILCTPVHPDGRPLAFAPDAVLARAGARLAEQGLEARFGQEVEFHIFPAAGAGTGRYMSASRYGELEPLLDAMRRHAQALGLPVRSVEIEAGAGQVEFSFAPGPARQQADALVMFRTLAREVCAREGYDACFMPRPAQADHSENAQDMGSGWHLHQSLIARNTGRNLFTPETEGQLTPEAAGWIAGLLAHASETSVLNAPTVNSYKRYRPGRLAPCRIAWGEGSRGVMLRALLTPGDAASRIENRAPDISANPYFALAAQIHAGMAGMEAGLTPPPAAAAPLGTEAAMLPRSLGQALDAFAGSAFCRAALGAGVADYLLQLKRSEWDRYLDHVSSWEQTEYSGLF